MNYFVKKQQNYMTVKAVSVDSDHGERNQPNYAASIIFLNFYIQKYNAYFRPEYRQEMSLKALIYAVSEPATIYIIIKNRRH